MPISSPTQTLNFRQRIVGIDKPVPLLDGREVPYVNLDNAASTPPLADVMEALEQFMPYYSSVHRGTGFKSRLSTEAYDRAHEIVAEFVGADPATNTVIFGKNTIEAINKLAYRLPLSPYSIVLTTFPKQRRPPGASSSWPATNQTCPGWSGPVSAAITIATTSTGSCRW